MRLYLDVCAIQRPLDDQSQLRIRLEAEAVLGVLALISAGTATLLVSDVHYIETRRNPHPNRRDFALEVLALATEVLPVSEAVAMRARRFATSNIDKADALHLAVAVEAGADYFCTTDDALLKKAAQADTEDVSVVTPLELVTKLEQT
jgi:predicted nucleic acid-binding protein